MYSDNTWVHRVAVRVQMSVGGLAKNKDTNNSHQKLLTKKNKSTLI